MVTCRPVDLLVSTPARANPLNNFFKSSSMSLGVVYTYDLISAPVPSPESILLSGPTTHAVVLSSMVIEP